MKRSPRIAIWHSRGDAYAAALRERLPRATIDAINASDHDSGADDDVGTAVDSALESADVLLAWKVPDGLLASMPALRWIQVSGAGVDHFLDRDDLPPTTLITRSLGRFGQQVAEYVIGYLLHHLLGIHTYRGLQGERSWQPAERPLLADRTVGVIGLGSLGLPTARALSALGTRVLGARHSEAAIEGVDRVFSHASWRDMLPECDALVIAAPRTDETVGMVDANALASLPRGAVLINVARGDIVAEPALLGALENGHLGAAVLDVFAVEPLPPDHPLWGQPRAWITPHVAAPSEVDVIADEFAENYRRFIDGRDMINLVDRDRGY